MSSAVVADLGVIKDARRRQRRRWGAIAVVVLVGVAVGLVARSYRHHATSPTPHSRPVATKPAPAPPAIVAPSAVFSEAPYMGVACRVDCDRVGIAVWLRQPARSVTAVIAGAPLVLWASRHQPWTRRNRPLRTSFGGYLHPAGLRTRFHVKALPGTSKWAVTRQPLVRFRIDYGSGRVVVTEERVPLLVGFS